ncbi:MAG: peptide chain release factor 2, partial [Peptostreptococcaceae bacterium]|nr:peptide chain release factor 2 [Peptostreptococcaceae bacterium]
MKEKINKSNFWDDQEQAQRILKISKKVELKIQEYDEIVKDYEDLSVLFELSI